MKYVKLAGHGICNHNSHQSNEIRTLCRLATGSGFLFLLTTSNIPAFPAPSWNEDSWTPFGVTVLSHARFHAW